MKISRIDSAPFTQTDNQISTLSWKVEYDKNSVVFRSADGKKIVLEGDLYYYLNNIGKPSHFVTSDRAGDWLKSVYDSADEGGFTERVEGIYNLAIIDGERDTVSVSGDPFNRRSLFYCPDGSCNIISTEFKDVLSSFDTVTYDPAVLSCLLILGYPPMKHTPYHGLCRLGIGEHLCLQNGKINLERTKVKPVVSMEMGEVNLDEYAEIFENAVLSRSSQVENWVGVSGGWDSTILLGLLAKHFYANKIRATVSAVKLSDGRIFNPYEVEKVVKIGKHYGVPVEVNTIDLADDMLNKLWKDTVRSGHSDFVYTHTFLFQAIADIIQEKGQAGAAVFFGSYADSIHNFGFSQGVSLQYLSNDFRNYSDKMMSYLYSPSFLGKVLNNTFKDDFVYGIFRGAEAGLSRWRNSENDFVNVSQMSKNERVFEYLLSFILSNSRLPFAPFATESVFSSDSKTYLKEWLWDNYFENVVKQIDCDNMYSWLISIYQHFHLQGFEKCAITSSLRGTGKRPCFPFYDLRMVKFLQAMPENWGRGLEWRPTKYPLKHYGRENLKIPFEIIESGTHSYIIETEAAKNVDLYFEIINNSALTAGNWDNLRSKVDLGSIFNEEWFSIETLNSVLKNGVSESGSLLPLRLFLLSTIKEGISGIIPV
ncbi:hypothetical protein ACFLWR_01370 [Chloroflexota bacterium]